MNHIVILISLIPIYLLINYFYKKDTIKEPKKLLKKLFLSGILSGFIVIIISIIEMIFFNDMFDLDNSNLFNIFIYSFIFVALIEEFCKWIMIYKISYNNKEFDQKYDIILYSVLVSMGFACLENILYIITSNYSILITFMRSITSIPGHACFNIIMGYLLSLNKFKYNNKKYLILSILIPTILHGTYDFLLLSGRITLIYLFFIYLIILFIISIILINKIIKIDKNNLIN